MWHGCRSKNKHMLFLAFSRAALRRLQENNMLDMPPYEGPNARKDQANGPSFPIEFRRTYRMRMFQEGPAEYMEVWDTLQFPFEAPSFPRGDFVFEVQGKSQSLL